MPNNVLKILYNAHVVPHLQYCTLRKKTLRQIHVWCNTYPTHLLPLFRLQKKIIRIITFSDYFDINKLQIASFMYKLLSRGNANNLLPQHDHLTRAREHLRIPEHNLTIFQLSLAYYGPKIWNNIPDPIKTLPSLCSFKRQDKKFLL